MYGGTKYPARYQGAVFLLEYSQHWLRVLFKQNDIFTGVQDFARFDTAVLTLTAEPIDGNICYITLNKGEVHCFKYVVTDIPPEPHIAATPSAGKNYLLNHFIHCNKELHQFLFNFLLIVLLTVKMIL